MDRNVQDFIAKSLKTLQKQIDALEKTVEKLDKRVRFLEPPLPDDIVVRNANGKIEVYLVRNEEGDYIDPREDRTEQ